ncbi:metal ABC transporter solute-binding protein, Zn/Mn family [Streptococcus cameli]
MKLKTNLVLVFLFSFFFLSACGQQTTVQTSDKESGLKIVTSFYPVYALTKAVSGDLNTIEMIQSNAGIHGFEPSANDVASIYDADVFIYHADNLESWATALSGNLDDSSVQVIMATDGMKLDKVKGLEDMEIEPGMDEASVYDPHTWNDPIKAAEEAKVIASQLSKIDPDNAAIYQKNAEVFSQEAQTLVAEYLPKFQEAKSPYFVTSHTAFAYLAKQFGLEQIGIAGISTEDEPTSRQIAEIQDFVKTYQVKTIFVEQGVSTKIAETIQAATGAKIVTLSPLETPPDNQNSYLENLETNLNILLIELNK